MEPESRRPPWTRILSIPREQETYHTRVILFRQNVAIIFLRQALPRAPRFDRSRSPSPVFRPAEATTAPAQSIACTSSSPHAPAKSATSGSCNTSRERFCRSSVETYGRFATIRSKPGWTFSSKLLRRNRTRSARPSRSAFSRASMRASSEISAPTISSFGKFRSQSERDDAAAGSNIDHARMCNFGFEVGNQQLDKLLGFRSRHQCAFVATKSAAVELDRAKQMLKWLACTAAPHHFTQRRKFRFQQRTFELQIQLYPLPAQYVRQQVLGV